MTAKWLAVVLIWVAGGATIVGTAMAWGVHGRGTVLVLGIIFALAMAVGTGLIATTENGRTGNG